MTLGPLMIDLVGPQVTPEEREMLAHPLVGGVILFARNYENPEQLLELTRGIHAVRSPPLLIAVDHEGGRVQRFRTGFSRLPPARRIGHLFDTDRAAGLAAARSMGWLMAAELRAHGVDLSFAPTVDLDYGLNEAIGDRALHPTADVTAQLAVSRGLAEMTRGTAVTVKDAENVLGSAYHHAGLTIVLVRADASATVHWNLTEGLQLEDELRMLGTGAGSASPEPEPPTSASPTST